MVGCSMDSDSMVDMVGRMDKTGKRGIENVDVVFCDACHNCQNRSQSHHHRTCHIDRNQIVSLFTPPFDPGLGYARQEFQSVHSPTCNIGKLQLVFQLDV